MKNGKPRNSRSEIELDERVLRYVEEEPDRTTVEELFARLRMETPWLTKAEVSDIAWFLAAQDKVNLQEPAPKSFVDFLTNGQENLWFYAALGIPFATILMTYFAHWGYPF